MPVPASRDTVLPALTGLRGIAAVLVVGLHLWLACGSPAIVMLGYPLHAWAACGYLGVDLFFVLSGFLLALPFVAAARGERPFPSLRTFFARRARRVLPAYWVNIAVLVVVAYAIDRTVFEARTLAAHVALLQVLLPGVQTINPVTWTLPVEWTFYLVLPLAGWAMLRGARWPFLLALALVWAVTTRLLVYDWWWDGRTGWVATPGSILHFNARVDQFAFGVVAAWVHFSVPISVVTRRVLLALGIVGLLSLVPWLAARGDVFGNADYPWLLWHFTVVALMWTLVVLGLAAPVSSRDARTPKVLSFLGMISFSLYLWHLPVIAWVWRSAIPASLGVPVAAAVALIGALLLAWLSYRFVERPFLPRDRAGAER
jgi:peptidoglycan/LPS O-acetylase OafA/YrhL